MAITLATPLMSAKLVATATLLPTSLKWVTMQAMTENTIVMPLPEMVCTALNMIHGKVISTLWLSRFTHVTEVVDGGTLAMVMVAKLMPTTQIVT